MLVIWTIGPYFRKVNTFAKKYLAPYIPDMKNSTKTNRDGFDLVLSKFKNQADMARALGVTRAVTSVWRTAGIPLKHIPALKKLTGLKGSQILPETAALLD